MAENDFSSALILVIAVVVIWILTRGANRQEATRDEAPNENTWKTTRSFGG